MSLNLLTDDDLIEHSNQEEKKQGPFVFVLKQSNIETGVGGPTRGPPATTLL
jgi:hypothetical protein